MRIRRLHGRDVRRYRTFDIGFAPGLTVLRGPNEAGKSTVQRALELAITRRATSTAVELEAIRPWGAPADARSLIAIEFEQDEEDGQKVGTLEKTFAGSKGTVKLVYDGQTIIDPTLADQVMAELTGLPTEGFFRATASVHHHELSDLSRDEGALRDRLQASISGADRGTSRAKKKLERALHELTTKGDKNPGRLKVAEAAVEQARAGLQQGELALAQLHRDRDAMSSARERRADADTALAERRSLLEKARQAERIMAERTTAQEKYDRYNQAVAVSVEIATLATTHPSPNPLPVIKTAVARLRKLDGHIRELKAALADEVEVKFDVAPEPTWQPLSRWSLALVAIGLLIALGPVVAEALGLFKHGRHHPARWARSSRSSALPSRSSRGGFGEARGRTPRCATSRSTGVCAAAPRWRRSSRSPRRKQSASSVRSALPTIAEAEDLLAREEAHVGQMGRLAAQLEGLVGKVPTETLPELRDAAAHEIEQKTSALNALGPIAKEPRARERLEVEVRDQEAALERARNDEANARARVEANQVDAEQVAGQAERLATWQEQLERAPAAPSRAREHPSRHRARRAGDDEERHPLSRGPHGPRPRGRDRWPVPACSGGRQDARHRGPCPGKGRLGARVVTEPGHARSRLPRRSPRARPARDRRPPASARVRRSVRDAR